MFSIYCLFLTIGYGKMFSIYCLFLTMEYGKIFSICCLFLTMGFDKIFSTVYFLQWGMAKYSVCTFSFLPSGVRQTVFRSAKSSARVRDVSLKCSSWTRAKQQPPLPVLCIKFHLFSIVPSLRLPPLTQAKARPRQNSSCLVLFVVLSSPSERNSFRNLSETTCSYTGCGRHICYDGIIACGMNKVLLNWTELNLVRLKYPVRHAVAPNPDGWARRCLSG